MKRTFLFHTILTLFAAANLVSCEDTWLEYDTSQKNKLYFTEGPLNLDQYISADISFALYDETTQELQAKIPVKLLGTVSDRDLHFEVRALHDTTTNFTTGGVARELVDAVENEDYTLGELVIPAGAVEGTILVTAHRTEKILTKTASLVLQIVENEWFEGVPRNVYRILISDGEPTCPIWWRYDAENEWYQYLGNFTADKYRKVLEFYHGIGDTNPSLYKTMIEQFGENIDNETYTTATGGKDRLTMGFMVRSNNPQKLAWVRYVLCPTFDYYKEHYPDAEVYTDKSVNVTTKGWRDPAYNY